MSSQVSGETISGKAADRSNINGELAAVAPTDAPGNLTVSNTGVVSWDKSEEVVANQQYPVRWASGDLPPEESDLTESPDDDRHELVPETDCNTEGRCQFQLPDFDTARHYLIQVQATAGSDMSWVEVRYTVMNPPLLLAVSNTGLVTWVIADVVPGGMTAAVKSDNTVQQYAVRWAFGDVPPEELDLPEFPESDQYQYVPITDCVNAVCEFQLPDFDPLMHYLVQARATEGPNQYWIQARYAPPAPPSKVALSDTGLVTWNKAENVNIPNQQFAVRWASGSTPPEESDLTEFPEDDRHELVPESDCDTKGSCQFQLPNFDATMHYLVQVQATKGSDQTWLEARHTPIIPLSDLAVSSAGLVTWNKSEEVVAEQQYAVRWAFGSTPPQESDLTESPEDERHELVPETDCDTDGLCQFQIPDFDDTMHYLVQAQATKGSNQSWFSVTHTPVDQGAPPTNVAISSAGLVTWNKSAVAVPGQQYAVRWAFGSTPPQESDLTESPEDERHELVPESDCDTDGLCQFQIPDFDVAMHYLVQVQARQGSDNTWVEARHNAVAGPGTPTSTPTSTPTPTATLGPTATPTATPIPTPTRRPRDRDRDRDRDYSTPTPTRTPTPTVAALPILAATPTPAPLPTVTPLPTPTPTMAPTVTPQPPTAAPTIAPTATPAPMATFAPLPTATTAPAAEAVSAPTPTPTPVLAAAVTPATPAPLPTETHIPTATSRPVIVSIGGAVPAASPTVTATPPPTPTPTSPPAPLPTPEPEAAPPAPESDQCDRFDSICAVCRLFGLSADWWVCLLLLVGIIVIIVGGIAYWATYRRRG